MRAIGTCFTLAVTLTAAAVPLAGQAIQGRASSLTLGGRLQVQYANSSVDEAVDDVFLRRARLEVDGTITERLDGRLQVDFGGGEVAVKDAYARYELLPRLRVTAGQFKRPFSIFELASSTDLPIIERDGRVEGLSDCLGVGGVCTFSRMTQKLEFDERVLGLRLDGRLGERITWYASVTNGSAPMGADETEGSSFAARLELAVAEDVVVSTFGALHDYIITDGELQRAHAFGADLEVGTWRDGLHVLAAAAGGENWEFSPAADFATAQILASYYVATDGRLVGVEPLLRVSWASTYGQNRAGFELERDGLLVTPGIMLYVSGKNGVALNLDVYDGTEGVLDSDEQDPAWSLKVQSFLYF